MTQETAVSRQAWLNVGLLAAAQAMFMSIQSMGTTTTPLAAKQMLGDLAHLATVPQALVHTTLMLTTLPAALVMMKLGRKIGFSIGAMCAVISGVISAYAVIAQSFILLCAGTMLQGAAAAFAWHYRFAATDGTPPSFRPRAISLVLAGGVAGAFIAREASTRSVEMFSYVYVGVYVMLSVFGLVTLLLVQGLKVPQLTAAERAEPGRPMREIARQPAFIAALLSSMFGYAVMTLVMTSTPLAMDGCGFKFADTSTVIMAHILGMFLPSFFTGNLINRFGVLPIIVTGALIEAVCAVVNLSGIGFWNFIVGNVLVGVGWNFTYVGGSTLLTSTYKPVERERVQGTHDFAVYSTTAVAAAASGLLQVNAGWNAVNIATFPMMAIVIGGIIWLTIRQRRDSFSKA